MASVSHGIMSVLRWEPRSAAVAASSVAAITIAFSAAIGLMPQGLLIAGACAGGTLVRYRRMSRIRPTAQPGMPPST